eukprot:CAMPEP_0182536160 /NCGR_PEP_ID=MMETSP1323-20130603/19460_1 /TAXON_ID=236787 /ORGANISM="Florenciella parvula, Strain RCC1693" /LENGTH=379 /DNA_ID=CAMNT_0024746367 /DNA_START=108 /DNA_END=1248 /DNA_ORIENTATION=-
MTFITQRGGPPPMGGLSQEAEIGELEALVSGVNQISQSTLLLKKKKEMHEVDDSLDFMKGEYKTRMEACDERQREFERRQSEMKEQVTKFEKFIQENDSKRQRAEVKLKQEKKFLHAKRLEFTKAQTDLDAAEQARTKMIEDLDKLRKYREYLERTVEMSEDNTYEEMWDLLNRYRTLKTANTQLMEQVQQGEAQIDEMRNELYTLNSAHTNHMLVQNSKIHSHQKHVEELRVANKQGADMKEKEEEGKKNESRETGQVILAIRNLYTRCLNTMHTRVAAVGMEGDNPADRLQMLDLCLKTICERIVDLNDIELMFDDFKHEHDRLEAEKHALALESVVNLTARRRAGVVQGQAGSEAALQVRELGSASVFPRLLEEVP